MSNLAAQLISTQFFDEAEHSVAAVLVAAARNALSVLGVDPPGDAFTVVQKKLPDGTFEWRLGVRWKP